MHFFLLCMSLLQQVSVLCDSLGNFFSYFYWHPLWRRNTSFIGISHIWNLAKLNGNDKGQIVFIMIRAKSNRYEWRNKIKKQSSEELEVSLVPVGLSAGPIKIDEAPSPYHNKNSWPFIIANPEFYTEESHLYFRCPACSLNNSE